MGCSCTVSSDRERLSGIKPYVEEKSGHIGVVTGVPVTVCEPCGKMWLDATFARALDAVPTEMLRHDTLGLRELAESATAV